jgi:hypothetical protein
MFNNKRTDKTLLLIVKVLWLMAVGSVPKNSKINSSLRRIGAEIALLEKEMK